MKFYPIMTEKQKMLIGDNYNSRDPELLEMYHRARDLTKEYNRSNSRDLETRALILSKLLGAISEKVWIEAPFYCDYGENIYIGRNTFINMNCFFLDNNKITIGENGLIGPCVQIYTASHPLKASERTLQGEKQKAGTYLTSSQPVSIGNNAWIGGNTVIMPGVTIGDNVTIGAASLVTKDISDNVLAFGNPCNVIKEL